MKKLFNLFSFLMLFAFALLTPKAFGVTIADIADDFWAKAEIQDVVDANIMTVDENGNFNPNGSVERAAFTSMLIKVLNQSNLDVNIENPFSDVNGETEYYDDIMRSEQIGLVYGYPDGTFRPKKDADRAEITSVISHITKDTIYDLSILDEFTDTSLIPEWAKAAYAKTVKYNLFVNYPDRAKFEPSREITRAETAVLLSKLKSAFSTVKEEYKAQEEDVEKVLAQEHLSIHSGAESNIVTITNKRKIISEGNILKVAFVERFKAKDANVGDSVTFTNESDITTDEGTLLIPAGAVFYGTIEDIVAPKRFNKPGSVKFRFTKVDIPNLQSTDMNATVYNNLDGYLTASTKAKLVKYTVGGLAVGAVAATAIGIPTDEAGAAYGIGLPVGAVGGFITGLLTKGTNYKANKGDEVYVKLNEALSIVDSL